MINKNDYRKINDKKILHKSGKTWKVVSLALLLAIGGGATVAATNANANADATDNAYNDAAGVTSDTAAQAEQLENNNYYGGSAKASVAPKSASKVTAKPSFANINYAPSEYYAGNNASAASYKNNESYDNANINYYGPIVSGYVDEINAKYPQARSLENNYNDLKGKTTEAKSAANSYSATYANSNTANVISAKASAAGQTTSYYTDSVAYHVLNSEGTNQATWGYMPLTSYEYKLASQESDVASGASLVSAIDANPALQTEYNDKYQLLSASAKEDQAIASNEAALASDIANNSNANQEELNDNRALLGKYSLAATIAGINSVVDSSTVDSIASEAGYKYTSSAVSSAVSALASADFNYDANNHNDQNGSNVSDAAISFKEDFGHNNRDLFASDSAVDPATTDDTSITFKGVNGSNSVSVGIGVTASQLASDVSNADSTNHASAVDANNLLRAVSDTAAQSAYANSASALRSNIAKESAAVNSYANALSSANSAAGKANAEYNASLSAKNAAEYLANDPVLADIFGNSGEAKNTYSYDANNLKDVTSLSANIGFANDALKYAGVNSNTATTSTSTFSAVSSAASALSTVGNELYTTVQNHPSDLIKNGYVMGGTLNTYVTGKFSNGSTYAAVAQNALNNAQIGVGHNGNANETKVTSLANDFKNFANLMGNSASSVVADDVTYPDAKSGLFNANSYSDAKAAFESANTYNLIDFDNDANSASASSETSAVNAMASLANSEGSEYNNTSSASASYAKATDQDVTISSQFASYYNSIASSDANSLATAKQSLDYFRATHASNPTAYLSASSAYASAVAAKPNDRDFAYAYGKNVLLNTPEYVTVTKNAMLHNDTQYAKSNSVESVKAGTQFAVKGVGFDLAGNVRYVVADHKGENLYLTANDQYVRNTYLAPSIDYTVTLAKPAVAHSTLGFIKDAKGTIPANTQLEGYTVPTSTSNNNRRDAAYGVTRLQVKGGKFNGDYITTNGKYFSNVTENNSNNAQANAQNVNPVQNTINFAD